LNTARSSRFLTGNVAGKATFPQRTVVQEVLP
jgi:hypothetical protein